MVSVKTALIVHGWGGSPDEKQLVYLKRELEESKIDVVSPNMPNPEVPTIKEWIGTLQKIAIEPEKAILIGHSVGCQTILRYLDSVKGKKKFAGIFLIAPWSKIKPGILSQEEKEIALPWETTKLELKNAKNKSKFFGIFYSVNDPFVSVDDALMLTRELNAVAYNLGEKGHLDESSSVNELPEVLDIIEKKCLI
jgi:hypothetical protein